MSTYPKMSTDAEQPFASGNGDNFLALAPFEKLFKATEFGVAGLLHALMLTQSCWFLARNWRFLAQFNDLSTSMAILLAQWPVCALLLCPYEISSLLSLINFISNDTLTSNVSLFLLAAPGFLAMALIPVSVFFITMDRFLVTSFTTSYTDARRRCALRAHIATLVFSGLLNLSAFLYIVFWRALAPISLCGENVRIFECLLGSANVGYFGYRSTLAALNSVGGAVFFVALYRANKTFCDTHGCSLQKRRANRINNLITGSAAVTEFLLNFIPHVAVLIVEQAYGSETVVVVGPISELANAIEGLVFILIYTNVLGSKLRRGAQAQKKKLGVVAPSRVQSKISAPPSHRLAASSPLQQQQQSSSNPVIKITRSASYAHPPSPPAALPPPPPSLPPPPTTTTHVRASFSRMNRLASEASFTSLNLNHNNNKSANMKSANRRRSPRSFSIAPCDEAAMAVMATGLNKQRQSALIAFGETKKTVKPGLSNDIH